MVNKDVYIYVVAGARCN